MDYLMVRPSTLSTLAFLAIVVVVALAVPAAVWAGALRALGPGPARRSALRACAITLAVLALSALLAESDALTSLPHGLGIVAYVVTCNVGAAALAFSPVGQRIASGLPLYALVGFQAFRLPLEFVLHRWYMEGVLPVQMTYEGHNFDIAVGFIALVLAPLVYFGKLSRRVAWAFNLLGAASLVNVASIAMRSSPTPLRTYMNEPAVLLALHAPYTWIVPICVGGALFGHLVTFRRLLGSEDSVLGESGTSARI